MKDEVEEFLRRVAQMRAQAEAQARGRDMTAQQQRPAPPRPPQKPQRPPPPARLVPQPAPTPQALPVEIIDADLADTSERLGQRVRSDLRESDAIAEHTRHLGEEVDSADSKMQAHLQQVFDHKLGQLKTTGGATALVTAERTAAELSLDQIRRMLAAPQSVRDAIIMSEVLRRPEF